MFSFRRTLAIGTLLGLAGMGLSTAAWSNDIPTTDRVEFVLECMNRNGGEQMYIYKCSCYIDEIAKTYKYDDYVEASTAARYRSAPGEGAGIFRDPDNIKAMTKKYDQVTAAARKTCSVPR